MPRFLVKLGSKYVEWSTVVDAPVTYGMTLEELTSYIAQQYGADGVAILPERLERLAATGTSSYNDTAESVIKGNRAGPGETELSMEQLIKQYC
jgi:hypothetical protein